MIEAMKILKEKGYKNTPARKLILQIFLKSKNPINVDTILKYIKQTSNKINEATIYRTIASFEKDKIIKKIDLRKESVYFEINKDHHHHIICTKCNLIEDFKSNEIENLLNNIIKKTVDFKIIKEHSFELFGLCNKCSSLVK